MYTTVRLVGTEEDQPVTQKDFPEFYRVFQIGVLLALKEDGVLTEMQCRNAEEILKLRRERGEGL